MRKAKAMIGLAALLVAASGCAGVRQEDLAAWEGAPVAALDLHPIFLTLPVVRTQAADGTEVRNYVNGRNVGICAGGAQMFGGGAVDAATFTAFHSCMQRFAACNNTFYIREGRVVRYVPVGTGGMRCYTVESLRPGGAVGGVNIR